MGKNKLSLKAILPKLAVLIGIMHPVYADNFPIQPLQNDPAVRKQLDRRTYEPVNQSNPDNLFPFRSHRGTVEHRTGSIRVTAASNIPLGGGVELQQLQYGGNIGFHTRFTGHGWKVHDPYDDTAQKTGYGKGQSVSDGYGPVAYAYTVKGSMVHPADGYEAPQGGNYPPPSKYGAHDRYSISVKGKASRMVQKPLDNTYGWNKAWENTKTAWSNGADYFTEAGRRIRSPIGIDLNQSIGTNAYNYTRYSIARTNGVIEAAFGIPTIVASNIWGIGSAAVDSYQYNEEYQKYRQDILAQNNMDAKTLFWYLYQTQQKHEYRQMEDADWQQFGQDFGNNLSRLEQEYPLTAESLKLAGNVAGLSSLGRNAAANTAKNSLDDIAGGAFKGGAGHDDFAQAAAAKFEQQISLPNAGSVSHVNPTGSSFNCTNCAYSVDNQLATGAKSSALPRSAGIPFSELDRFYNTKFSGDMSKAQIESTLLSKGNGTQAIVYGVDSSGRYGHVWNAVVQNGKVNYIDGQIGKGGATNFQNFPRHLRIGITKQGTKK